ncbi:YdcF family protein [Paramagnetospirillum marisnigri]|nr:YdcF family protein [Paramagnetospirillum marisnigri]
MPRIVSVLGTTLAVLLGAWGGGLLVFAATMAAGVEDRDTVTDAIVVLTGGSDRLTTGLTLLAQGKGRSLLISGVHKGVDLPELLRKAGQPPMESHCCITLGHAADDTVGNAVETAAWMAEQRFTSLRLVTAAYHMQRAMLELRRVMPQAAIVAHPVFPDAFKKDQWWRWPGTAHLLATEYTKYLGALARPLFIPKPPERKS